MLFLWYTSWCTAQNFIRILVNPNESRRLIMRKHYNNILKKILLAKAYQIKSEAAFDTGANVQKINYGGALLH